MPNALHPRNIISTSAPMTNAPTGCGSANRFLKSLLGYFWGFWSSISGCQEVKLFYGQTKKEGASLAKLAFRSNFSVMEAD